MKTIVQLFFVLIVSLLALGSAEAQQSHAVVVKVDGLACPYCAFGLEKRFKEVAGVRDIKIDVKEGFLTFVMSDANLLSEKDIKQHVKKAGFTPRKVVIQKKKHE